MDSLRSPSRVTVETLESRTFLSVSPMVHHSVADLTAAIKVPATVPAVSGTAYGGIATSVGGTPVSLIILFVSESKTGAVHGELVLDTVSAHTQFAATGTVSKARKVTLRGRTGSLGIAVTGTLSADLTTIICKYTTSGAKKNTHGTVSVTRRVQSA